MKKKLITSFTHLVTGEGDRIAFTYSEVSENGTIISQNNKGSFVVVDDQNVEVAIKTINESIANYLTEE